MGNIALYNTAKRVIERGNAYNMEKKLGVFLEKGKLTAAQYNELTAMLSKG